MRKEFQDLIKTDQQDLQKLTDQVQKVERLKKQYHQQKQEIGSLKNTILELQSENQQLRSRGKSPNLSQKQKNSEESIQKAESPNQATQSKKVGSKFVDEGSSEEPNRFQVKTNPRIRNQSIDRYNRKNKSYLPRFDESRQMKQYPQPSLRNHSGFISSTRKFVSPPGHTRKDTWGFKGDIDYSSDSSQEYQRIDLQHLETKKNLYCNLIADMKMQLEQKDKQLAEGRATQKKIKKQLKKEQEKKTNYWQANKRVQANYEILEKQNYYLKQQLVKQTEAKIRWENLNSDLVLWYNTTAKRIYEEFQLEFIAMDNIYSEFERIHARTASHLGR